MNFRTENIDNVIIFTILDNTLEGLSAAELKSQLLIVAQPNIRALVLDLTNISLIDSDGLRALLLAYRQLKDHNVPVILVGIQDSVDNLLEMTHIKEIFGCYTNLSDAMESLK